MRPFVERMQTLAEPQRTAARRDSEGTVRRMRDGSLAQSLSACDAREEAAHTESSFTIRDIAMEFGLSVSRISRLIAREEETAFQSRVVGQAVTDPVSHTPVRDLSYAPDATPLAEQFSRPLLSVQAGLWVTALTFSCSKKARHSTGLL